MEDVGGTSQAVIDSEGRDYAVVQHLDPFDWLMDAIALADGKQGKAVVFFIPRWCVLVGLLPKFCQLLMEVSDGGCIFVLLLVVKSVPVLDGLDK